MKKLMLLTIAMLNVCMAMAVPSYRGDIVVTQPDGTTLTVRLHGDEYLHFTTTADGYTVEQRSDGYYTYARLDTDGQLAATEMIAHDAGSRSAAEQSWLAVVGKNIMPRMTTTMATEKSAERTRRAEARSKAVARAAHYDYDRFRGLILLVEFNDRAFSRDDYADIVNDIANMPDYQGYDKTTYGTYTGSVRDYFYDNSFGRFSPKFDVVGPIKLDKSQYEVYSSDGSCWRLMKEVVDAADDIVDFSQYDGDDDGTVDMVYMIFAGLGSHMGNDKRLLWPHASAFWTDQWPWYIEKDGMALYRYACSTELYGDTRTSVIDGIGTICHEFSHVLGLPDLYDTDDVKSGGSSADPGEWTIMAGGGYQNYGRTPSGYSIYERYALGFAYPKLISTEGNYELEAIGDSNDGYRIDSPVKKEYFLLENRQKTSKWDKYLPGHGLLVFRVDSTNSRVWNENTINCNPKHNYFVLLRAKGGNTSAAKASDPFPGTGRVTELNNNTSPANMLTWSGKTTRLGLENITESGGRISFDIIDTNILKSISLPEEITVGLGLTTQIVEMCVPDYASYTLKWTTSDPSVATVDVKGVVTGVSIGEAVITVVANDDENLTAQCKVRVEDIDVTPDVASFKQQEEGMSSALSLVDALVLFANDKVAFIRDATGAIKVEADGLGLGTGDMLNGLIYGELAVENGVKILKSVDSATNANGFKATKGNSVEPRRIRLDDVCPDDYSDLITIVATPLERTSGVWAVGSTRRARLYNGLQISGISVPKVTDGKYYDVTGIMATNVLKNEIIDEIELTQPLVEVEAPSAIGSIASPDTPATVYTSDGRLAARTTVAGLAMIPLRHGVYIVKTASQSWRLVK